jgi:hypothetical protein
MYIVVVPFTTERWRSVHFLPTTAPERLNKICTSHLTLPSSARQLGWGTCSRFLSRAMGHPHPSNGYLGSTEAKTTVWRLGFINLLFMSFDGTESILYSDAYEVSKGEARSGKLRGNILFGNNDKRVLGGSAAYTKSNNLPELLEANRTKLYRQNVPPRTDQGELKWSLPLCEKDADARCMV